MTKGRLEAFSDGVIAIIITIMVLELRIPEHPTLYALTEDNLHLKFGCYVLSFVHIAIYWNNHHHLLHSMHRVNGAILWANMHLLFWLSLVPFVTSWMGESGFALAPTGVYGFVMLCAGIAYYILVGRILRVEGRDSTLGRAVGVDVKGKISPLIYMAAIALVLVNPWISCALYAAVALMWLVPDRRIERILLENEHK